MKVFEHQAQNVGKKEKEWENIYESLKRFLIFYSHKTDITESYCKGQKLQYQLNVELHQVSSLTYKHGVETLESKLQSHFVKNI